MEYANIDTTNFPIIIITFANIEPKESEFEDYLASLDNLHLKYKGFIILFNASVAKYLSSNLRIKQGFWLKENTEKIKKNCLGTAYFIPSILTNALLNCIFAISKPPVPYTIVTTYAKALDWCNELSNKNLSKIRE